LLTSVVLFLASSCLSLLLTWFVRNLALKRGWVSTPRSARHLHKNPIPHFGGVAVYIAFVATTVAVMTARYLIGSPMGWLSPRTLLVIVGPATLIFVLGLLDDIFDIRPFSKFAVQIAAAMMLYASGLRIMVAPVFGTRPLGALASLALTVVWVVWITNAFNLIDGMDGLAAGSALLSTIVIFLNALLAGNLLTLFFTAALAGAVLGFLRFNFNPATIFLGDCGSLFIGFVLAALAIPGTKSPTVVAVAIPVVALGLPVVDTFLSVIRRFLSGRPLFSADREHIHHKLLEKGLSQRQVVLVLYGVSALFGLFSLFLKFPSGRIDGTVLVVLGSVLFFGIQRLGYVEMFELRRVAIRTLEQRQVIINNLSLRRASRQLAEVSDPRGIARVVQAAFENNGFDSFELAVHLRSSARNDLSPQIFSWHKGAQTGAAQWQLTLDLIDDNGRRRGSLTLARAYSDESLMLDVNILTSELPVAIANALQRAEAALKTSSEPVLAPAKSANSNLADAGNSAASGSPA